MIELFGILLIPFLILIGIKLMGVITWTGVVIGMLTIIIVVGFIAASQDTY
jgi:hypothetical protein